MDKISVIVPVYNAEAYLERCIESILNQTYQNMELVLVDDGSTDSSGIICDKYSERPDVKILHKENGGVSSARNAGLLLASGKYVGFVDSDDYIEKNMFELMHDGIRNAGLCMCGYFKNKEKHVGVTEKQIVGRMAAVKCVIEDRGFKGYLWNKLFYKAVIDKYHLHFMTDIYIGEDLLFCISYIDKTEKVCLLPDVLYHYEEFGESLSNCIFDYKRCSIISAYNMLLDMELIRSDAEILETVRNRKIKHCLSLWMMLARNKISNKAVCSEELKREIKHENMRFLLDKNYEIKYKLLFLLLKIF